MEYVEYADELTGQLVSGDTIIAIAIALIAYAGLAFVRSILKQVVRKRAKRADSVWSSVLSQVVSGFKGWFFAAVAVYFGARTFDLSSATLEVLDVSILIALVAQVAVLIGVALDDVLTIQFGKEGDETTRAALQILSRIGAVIIWVFALLFVLSNLGIDTTSLVAGLGVGGIAIALALQGILGDLFSAFTVFFDRPFEVGDFVGYKDKLGTVKKVGIMTTRIELLSGEELVVTNQELTTNMLENYTRLQERRAAFSFGVVYEISSEQVAAIPEIVKEVIENVENVRFDRAHFKEFGDSALLFEVVYYVEDPDYNIYMDIQQEINIEIMRRFEREGIALARPTQTVYIKQGA